VPRSLLVHACCAPCAAYPLRALYALSPEAGILVWYYNPNVHPAAENRRRRDALAYLLARRRDFLPPGAEPGLDLSAPYRPEEFLEAAAADPRRPGRCVACYRLRLEAAARRAREAGAAAFTTTLLYSRRQDHEAVRSAGEAVAASSGTPFFYRDFRDGWKEGREICRELDVYRQSHCGCVYGEIDN
jgi:predicted adenine nucleotide alpha hydrolase (AANH) superfamily ATPase